MKRMTRIQERIHGLLATTMVVVLTALSSGCGGEEEQPASTPEAGTPASSTPAGDLPEHPTAPPGVAMGDVVPETLSVLRYMPPGAQAAFALPPVPTILDDVRELGGAVAPPAMDVDGEIDRFFTELGAELGVQVENFTSLADAMGLDPDSPIAFFADFSRMVPPGSASGGAVNEPAAGKPTLEDGDAGVSGVPQLESKIGESAAMAAATMDEPAWVAVVEVVDAEKAIAALQSLAGEDEALAAAPAGVETAGGVELTTRGDYGYFLAGSHLAFGDLALLRGAAGRVAAPATFRYGTVECPATERDEMVALFYGGRLLPLLEQGMAAGGAPAASAAAFKAQLATYQSAFPPDDQDPIVATFARSDGQLEMTWRVDMATHPGLEALIGPATPLRLAPYLPENTLALLSLRFNEQYKAQLSEAMVPAVGATGDSDLVMQAGMAAQVVRQLGDELTIGLAEGGGLLPDAYVLLALAEPESTRALLETFIQMKPEAEHEGVPIRSLESESIPVPLYLGFLDDFVVATSTGDGIRTLISRYKAGEPSGLFAALEPPYDQRQPQYQLTVIKSQIAEEAIGASAAFSAEAPDPGAIAPLLAAVRELRSGYTKSGSWLKGDLTIYLGDLEEAAALRDTLAGAAPAATPSPASEEASAEASTPP